MHKNIAEIDGTIKCKHPKKGISFTRNCVNFAFQLGTASSVKRYFSWALIMKSQKKRCWILTAHYFWYWPVHVCIQVIYLHKVYSPVRFIMNSVSFIPTELPVFSKSQDSFLMLWLHKILGTCNWMIRSYRSNRNAIQFFWIFLRELYA